MLGSGISIGDIVGFRLHPLGVRNFCFFFYFLTSFVNVRWIIVRLLVCLMFHYFFFFKKLNLGLFQLFDQGFVYVYEMDFILKKITILTGFNLYIMNCYDEVYETSLSQN